MSKSAKRFYKGRSKRKSSGGPLVPVRNRANYGTYGRRRK